MIVRGRCGSWMEGKDGISRAVYVTEWSGAVKAAPVLDAAKRALAGEHRSGNPHATTGGPDGIHHILTPESLGVTPVLTRCISA